MLKLETGFDPIAVKKNNDVQLTENPMSSLYSEIRKPTGIKTFIEPGLVIEPFEDDFLVSLGYVIGFPIETSGKKLKALLLLGKKKSENKFSFEDVDFLTRVAIQAGLTIERIELQEGIIREKLEKERLVDLSIMKSIFISGVSYELKTPLTSIHMFAELMSQQNTDEQKRVEYFKIIEGESNRLTNMINNILSITKIEKGIKEYNFTEIELNSIINKVLNLLEYQLTLLGFEVVVQLTEEELLINGDESAIHEIIINLLSNSIKYSKGIKQIKIISTKKANRANIFISDKGIGINREDMKSILIIEDDPAISKGLSISLAEENLTTKCASDGIKGFADAVENKYDLILLDLMLPGMTGMELCKKLRSAGNTTPIIILTSKADEIDKVLGLELGADDYLTKPFSIRELIARIKAVLRRSENKEFKTDGIRFGNIIIDIPKHEVYKNNEKVKLSVTGFKLIVYFYNRGQSVISRDELLDEVWGYDSFPSTRTVDNYILSLRKKLEDDPSEPRHLITVPKGGYRFVR